MNRRNFLKEGTFFAATALTTGGIIRAVTSSVQAETAPATTELGAKSERAALFSLNSADQEVLAFLRTHSAEVSFLSQSAERTEIRARISNLSVLAAGLQSHKGQFGKIIARGNTIRFTHQDCAYIVEHQLA